MGSPIDKDAVKLILDKIQTTANDLEKRLSDKITNLTETISSIQKTTTTNTSNIIKLEEKFNKHKTTCDNDRQLLRKMTRTVDQKRLVNDVVLKGFPNGAFDEKEVMQNVAASCGMENGFNDCYKFSRNIGVDKQTNEPRWIHVVTLSFISHMDKMKLFARLKEEGHFMLPDLITECDEGEKSTQIWIENALTIENLKIKKRLLQLKRDGKIVSFTMRSGLFVVQHKSLDGQMKSFNVYELSHLQRIFPQTEKENEKK
jgi:hypothetical protein